MANGRRAKIYEMFLDEVKSEFAVFSDDNGPWDVIPVDAETGVIRRSQKVASCETMDEAVAHAVTLWKREKGELYELETEES